MPRSKDISNIYSEATHFQGSPVLCFIVTRSLKKDRGLGEKQFSRGLGCGGGLEQEFQNMYFVFVLFCVFPRPVDLFFDFSSLGVGTVVFLLVFRSFCNLLLL